jgi:hypothetical protein
MRVFGNPLQSRPPLVLAACKFLDLVLILPPEQFSVYEWMFITDSFEHMGQKLAFVPYIEQLAQQGRNCMATCYYKLNPPTPIGRQPQIVTR